jgi:hypothetical protein
MNSPSKKRESNRLDLQLRVRFHTDAQATQEGEATDVSSRGARLECREPVAEGARLHFELDSGDGNAIKGTGTVTWVRERPNPGGKKVWDAGVKFDEDWLRGERGPLARALGRFFAATDTEPARDFQRVRTHLVAQGRTREQTVALMVTDLGEGGLRVNVDGPDLPAGIKVGAPLHVSFGEGRHTRVAATVAWVVDGAGSGAVHAQFGVSFGKEDHAARDAVLAILGHLGKSGADVPPILIEVA